MRLDRLLVSLHPSLSRRKAREVVEKGQVTVDGELVREPGRDVTEQATVLFDPNRRALPRIRPPLPLLHEDEHVLIVDKPAGLLSVPTAPGAREDTALSRVREYARRVKPRGAFAERVHRLDRDTSGALAFALSRASRAALIRTFREHRIERCYLAIVEGEPRSDAGEVDVPLRDAWASGRRAVARPGEAGLAARTSWRVLERFSGAALLEVRLATGRQHQIRVHLAHVGTPVLGDPVYGHPSRLRLRARRPLLHAWRLAFDHPVTGVRIQAESPPPDDFKQALRALRRGHGGIRPGRSRASPA
jgi:23S rRNA pseudouridine1911/1915/1917 synthase